MEIRGITISVGYGDVLAITLARNMRHLSECLVVTSPDDARTLAVCQDVPGVRVHVTDAFTRHGAAFNKGLAMEEGFDSLGRHGWILIWDADILLPDSLPFDAIRPHQLHGATRRILEDPTQWSESLDWRTCSRSRDMGPIGFFQLFDAESPCLYNKRPWYDVSFAHAGGGDAYFITHFDAMYRRMLPCDVLHLGPKDTHWFGTDPAAKDVMAAFIVRNGWDNSHPRVDRSACDRVGEIRERVDVPGYEPSGFELPFVRRAKSRQSHG